MRLNFEDDMMDLCDEPGCKEPALRAWNGKKLCNEHYETFCLWEAEIPGAS